MLWNFWCVGNEESIERCNMLQRATTRIGTDSGAPMPEKALAKVHRQAFSLLHNHDVPKRVATRWKKIFGHWNAASKVSNPTGCCSDAPRMVAFG